MESKPNIFLYSLILPIVWVLFGVLFNFLFPGTSLGPFGLVIIIHLVLFPICWHFSSKFQRQFNKPEKVKLVSYLTLGAVFCESLGLLSSFSAGVLSREAFADILAFTFLVDAIFMYLGVHFVGKRFINYFLAKQK